MLSQQAAACWLILELAAAVAYRVNGLAVGAEDTGIRPLLLIAREKDLFELGESKPAGLQWGVVS